MALMRVKLSDGTTTVDLFSGSDALLLESAITMPPPKVSDSYITSRFEDGAPLAYAVYENRTITLPIKIWGSSLSDLKTNVRQIQRMLNDAQYRSLKGYGAKYYLELQWGDSNGESTFFDVMRGDLRLPTGYLGVLLVRRYFIVNALLTLECLPFGRYTNQSINSATIDNSQSTYDVIQSYLENDDGSDDINAANDWAAQTFTTPSAYSLTRVAIYISRTGSPGTITVEIYATSAGEPTGAPLGSTTVNGDLIQTVDNVWLVATFGTPVSLSNGVQYALVIRGAGFAGANYISWRKDTAGATFAGGNKLFSIDGGATWASSAGTDYLFVLYTSEAQVNYQDISTSEGYGDVPARMYIKLAQASATGTKKVWVAKRTGTRQTDDLWLEGEDYSSFTSIEAGPDYFSYPAYFSQASGDTYARMLAQIGIGSENDVEMCRLNFTISTVPRGQFRVLARVRVVCDDANDYDHPGFGIGWSYGGRTYSPVEANGEYYTVSAHNTWETLDLGLLNLPPVQESEIAGNNTIELRLFIKSLDTFSIGEDYNMDVDFIFLLSIDEGIVIVADVINTDTLAIDGISSPKQVYTIDGSDKVSDIRNSKGIPFDLGRENTRIYILRDDNKDMDFTSTITYQPRYLVI